MAVAATAAPRAVASGLGAICRRRFSARAEAGFASVVTTTSSSSAQPAVSLGRWGNDRRGFMSPDVRFALTPRRRNVSVSQALMKQFLDAEFLVLARGGYNTITLEQILSLTDLATTAKVIQKELPARFSVRLQEIEGTTPEWQDIPSVARLHDILKTSFTNLRLVEFEADGSLDAFTKVIRDLRARHMCIMPLLYECGVDLKKLGIKDNTAIHEWLMKFMNSRMGTEMLTKHYVLLLEGAANNQSTGIVDTACKPARICEEAIEHVKTHIPIAADVNIELKVVHPNIAFSFISTYLFWIIVELIANSVRAVHKRKRSGGLRSAGPTGQAKPDVAVTVCADSSRIGIGICDKGGGIPFDCSDSIWEYMFSTTDPEEPGHGKILTGPLHGRGMGLPNCSLYINYLGGSIDLMSMPGVGTDVYLFFDRVETKKR
eukprot:TRINITY_DN27497_c0_g1_i1.p1 TRINITY_DN27497_c0_g1~~TRINITY_DN27497_c0_g1_i1.p1  ORF type:complete len:432 (+),score=72.77 TRINITY_DN27497_c0_g1_i1:116-1411(+)